MARKRNPVPSYLKHKNGNARAVWTDAIGVRRYRTLPGPYGSKQSLEAFAAVQLEAAVAPVVTVPVGLTVIELLLAFFLHAEKYYRDTNGGPTDEMRHLRAACRPVRDLF